MCVHVPSTIASVASNATNPLNETKLNYRYESGGPCVMASGVRFSWTCAVMAWSRARTVPRGAEGAQMAITMQSTPTHAETATNPNSSSSRRHCMWLLFPGVGSACCCACCCADNGCCCPFATEDDEIELFPDDDNEAPPVVPAATSTTALGGTIPPGSRLAYSSPNRP
jgi:hypothetical protein